MNNSRKCFCGKGGGAAEAKTVSVLRLQRANLKTKSEGCRKADVPFGGKEILVVKPGQTQSRWPPEAQS